jgi:Ca2+-binding RTX toxin-like protein
MAKLTLNALLEGNELGNFYTTETLDLQTDRANKAVYVDTDSGNKIIIEGAGFSYDGEIIEKGRIEEITFVNGTGDEFAVTTHVNMGAERLSSLLLGDGVQSMMRVALRQDDVIYGSANADVLFGSAGDDVLKARAGADELDGGKGDDRLIGGGGSDLFIFVAGGDDVVSDFDATGGGDAQDYIGVESMDGIRIRDHGDDVVVHFDNGDSLTLLDVKRSAVSEADFQLLV